MRREEIDILAARGIIPAMAMDALLRMEYVGMTGPRRGCNALGVRISSLRWTRSRR
jgi:hypothetical protein